MVLNPVLYERLRRTFGPVKLSNAGQRFVARDGPSLFAEPGEEAKMHLEIVSDGEYYRVACPYCTDTRHRLFVNYMFGKKSDAGRVMNFLAVCFNEGCLARQDNKEDFDERLACFDHELEDAPVKEGRQAPSGLRTARWPGAVRRLDRLSERHPACQYLRSRRFDPGRLGRFYDVHYCTDSIYFLARRRLVFPVYWGGALVGWQTRHVGELDWKGPRKHELPPKWWTMPGMPRGEILANLDNAKHYRTGVLVEGWFDVVGFGPMAMPVLGNSVSPNQQKLFARPFGGPGRSGVLLLDPEEFESHATQRTARALAQRMSGQLAVVKLPEGRDPGNLDRDFMRDYVRDEAADQGVDVGWERVED